MQFAVAYIFNLIVGVGALSLPKAFSDAGIILGTVLLILLALTSYVTATYMIEAMAIANAYKTYYRRRKQRVVNSSSIQGGKVRYRTCKVTWSSFPGCNTVVLVFVMFSYCLFRF